MRAHLGAHVEQAGDERNRRRLAHVVGVGLEGQAQHGDGLAAQAGADRVGYLPRPRALSCTSAPTFSERSAISLMKVILVARKALAAYLISSAVRRAVNISGPWFRDSGRENSARTLRPRSLDVPITMRSGNLKSRIAAPSRRNSGLEATSTSA